MTLDELSDNFAAHAEEVYKATAAGVGLVYTGQTAIQDTVREVIFQLSSAQHGRNWGGMEAAAKVAIEAVLNKKAKRSVTVEPFEPEPEEVQPKKKR